MERVAFEVLPLQLRRDLMSWFALILMTRVLGLFWAPNSALKIQKDAKTLKSALASP
jgi:NhaP-type Na+/H+ and K+/H+ antiporter